MFYKFEGKFTSDALKQFVADYRSGVLVGKEKEPYKPPASSHDHGDGEEGFDPAGKLYYILYYLFPTAISYSDCLTVPITHLTTTHRPFLDSAQL